MWSTTYRAIALGCFLDVVRRFFYSVISYETKAIAFLQINGLLMLYYVVVVVEIWKKLEEKMKTVKCSQLYVAKLAAAKLVGLSAPEMGYFSIILI